MTTEYTTFRATAGDDIEPGIYEARLMSIEVREGKEPGTHFRVWTFSTPDFDISGTSSMSDSTSSKAYSWITAILGRQPQVGEVIEVATLNLLPVNIVVTKGTDGFARIESLATIRSKPTK
jgi:hypothetical protein